MKNKRFISRQHAWQICPTVRSDRLFIVQKPGLFTTNKYSIMVTSRVNTSQDAYVRTRIERGYVAIQEGVDSSEKPVAAANVNTDQWQAALVTDSPQLASQVQLAFWKIGWVHITSQLRIRPLPVHKSACMCCSVIIFAKLYQVF